MSNDIRVSYIWPLETVSAIERLHASLMVDQAHLVSHGEKVMAAARDELVRHLQKLAEPWAAIPHAEDYQFCTSEPLNTPRQIKVECAWRPSTNAAEMHGGPVDGEVYALQRIGDPFEVATPRPVLWATDDQPYGPATLAHDKVTYRLAGWSEASRRWVYRP